MTEEMDSYDKHETLDTLDNNTAEDSVHEKSKTLSKGDPLVQEQYRGTIETVENDRFVKVDADDEVVNFDSLNQESDDNGKDSPKLPRAVVSKDARQQVKDGLKAAMATFEFPKQSKEPANDNFRPVGSWPLMDQLTRSTFEPDRERRSKYAVTARYIRELVDLTESDPLGDDKDCDVQRSESGSVHFEHGQSLDRKKRTRDKKNGEPGALRHDGPLKTVKKSTFVDNRVSPTDPFALRVITAREELDAIRLYIGSALWPLLIDAISENASMTDIGLKLGARGGQAPPVGTAVIRLALTTAIDALATVNWLRDEPYLPTPLPDKSRGSFLNQTPGPVRKVAA